MADQSVQASANLHLRAGKSDVPLVAGQHFAIRATAGQAYRVVKHAGGSSDEQLASDVVAQRSGADLQLDYADGTRVTLQDYFNVCKTGAACGVTLAGDAPSGYEINADSKLGAQLADGSAVLYAHGSPDMLASMVPSHSGLDSPLAGLKGEQITYIPQDHNGLALILGGAIASIALGGGGGGGGAPAPAPAVATVHNYVKLSFIGGPAVAGNDLTVEIYKADGKTLLGTGTMAADGTVTVDVHDYTGVVVAKVINSGASPDYLDEATGQPKDLSVQLFTMGVITDPNSTINVNVNILTTIAYTKAIAAADGSDLTPALVNDMATAVSKLFQIDDILHTGAVSTNGGSYNAADGLSAGEKYGAVLAAFSGADALGNGNSQDTLNTVLAGITLSTVNGTVSATITEAAQTHLVNGAKLAAQQQSGGDTGSLPGDVSLIIDTYPPTFTNTSTNPAVNENVGAGHVVYTATATDPSGVSFSLKAGSGDAAAFSIDAGTGAVTLIGNPDFETRSSYTFTVLATDSSGNQSSQVVTLAVNNVDEVAPTLTSASHAAVNESVSAGALVYTAASTDTVDYISGSTVYSLTGADAAAFSINASTGAVTINATPGGEAPAGYSFTVVATDAAGNSSQEQVALTVNGPTSAVLTHDTGFEGDNTDRITRNAALSFSTPIADVTRTYHVDDGAASSSYQAPTADGTHTVTVTDTDSAGHTQTATVSFTLDTHAAAPIVGLSSDTGSSHSDAISSVGTLVVSGIETGAQVAYSTDGTNWSGSFTPVEGANTVYVHQTDVAGNVSAATPFSFTLDTHAPTLNSSTPADDATGVAAPGNLTLNFSEAVHAGTGNITLVNDDNPDDSRTIAVTDTSQVSFSGSVMTINPAADLLGGGHYHIELGSTAVQDVAGNAFAGISDSSSHNFTVAVTPVMISVNEAGVWLDANHNGVVDNGEQVLDGTAALNGQLIASQSNAPIDFSNGSWTVKFWDVSSFGPSADLSGFGADDKVVVDLAFRTDNNGFIGGAFLGAGQRPEYNSVSSGGAQVVYGGYDSHGIDRVDVAVMPITNMNGALLDIYHTYSRTDSGHLLAIHMGPGFDPVHNAGQLSFVLPPDDFANAPLVSLTTDSGSSNGDKISNDGSVTVSHTEPGATVEYSTDGTNWTHSFTPVEGANTVYARQTDVAGNVSAASTAYTYTLDTHAPTLVSSTPADDATAVAVGSNLTLNFSETVHAGTGSIHLVNDDNSSDSLTIAVGDTSQVTFSGTTMTLNPTADLDASSHYHIEVDSTAVQDVAGNSFAGISDSTSHNFVTALPPATPVMISVSKDGGVWLDANHDGIHDMGEQGLTAGSALNGQSVTAQSGAAIDFSSAAWNVKFWTYGGPDVDLTGFGSDDKITVKLDNTSTFFGRTSVGFNPSIADHGTNFGVAFEGGAVHRYVKVFANTAATKLQSSTGDDYHTTVHAGAPASGPFTLAHGLAPAHHPIYEFLLPIAG